MTYDEFRRIAVPRLHRLMPCDAQVYAAIVFSKVSGLPRERLLLYPDSTAPDSVLFKALEELEDNVPLQYVVGSAGFYSREFVVGSGVLIPRPETELLVEQVLILAPSGARVVDVGTGSGAIAITLHLERKDLRVIGTDVSPPALDCARANRALMDASVPLVLADMLATFQDSSLDVVVANPPYIAPDDPRVDDSVRRFEPAIALFSERGLAHIARMISEARRVLAPLGMLAFEFGVGQAADVVEMLADWRDVRIVKDLAGHDRIAIAWLPSHE